MSKCSCIEERRQKLIELCQADEIIMPIEILSGRIYIEFEKVYTVNGKQKRKQVPLLLGQCPFCGTPYDKPAGAEDGVGSNDTD